MTCLWTITRLNCVTRSLVIIPNMPHINCTGLSVYLCAVEELDVR